MHEFLCLRFDKTTHNFYQTKEKCWQEQQAQAEIFPTNVQFKKDIVGVGASRSYCGWSTRTRHRTIENYPDPVQTRRFGTRIRLGLEKFGLVHSLREMGEGVQKSQNVRPQNRLNFEEHTYMYESFSQIVYILSIKNIAY